MTLTTLPPYKSCALPHGDLAYREAGAGDAIVLIHGVGMQSAAWAPQIAALATTHQVIALDMPGHGNSSPLTQAAQLPDFVDWLEAAVSALKLEQFSLAGHSMGALIAAGFAVTHPKRLDGVALLNGVFRRTDAARKAVTARADLIRSGGFDLETPLARWFGDSPMEQAARAQVSNWLSDVNLDGYALPTAPLPEGMQPTQTTLSISPARYWR